MIPVISRLPANPQEVVVPFPSLCERFLYVIRVTWGSSEFWTCFRFNWKERTCPGSKEKIARKREQDHYKCHGVDIILCNLTPLHQSFFVYSLSHLPLNHLCFIDLLYLIALGSFVCALSVADRTVFPHTGNISTPRRVSFQGTEPFLVFCLAVMILMDLLRPPCSPSLRYHHPFNTAPIGIIISFLDAPHNTPGHPPFESRVTTPRTKRSISPFRVSLRIPPG